MLGKVWGFDTETVLKNGGGWPYTFQLVSGNTQLFHVQNNLNASMFRAAFLAAVGRYCEDGDSLWSYNLLFENAVLLRDRLWLFKDNRLGGLKVGDCTISGVLDDPTPFLKLKYPDKVVWVLDAAKFFQGDEGGSLAVVAKEFLPSNMRKLPRPRYLGQRKPKPHEMPYFKKYSMLDAYLTSDHGLGGIAKQYHLEAGLDEWCFSVAHLAGRFFNKKFTDNKKLDLANNHIEGCALWARFGGYRRGWVSPGVYEDYLHLDLKSAYPWAYSRMRSYLGGRYVQSRSVPKDGEGIFKIETVLPKNEIRPLFQRRGKKGEILTQPINTPVRFWTTGCEIQAYRKVWPDWSFRIVSGYEWKGPNKYKPLKEWANYAFGIKDSAPSKKHWKYSFGKALANHITGKFDSSLSMSKETWLTPSGEIDLQESRPGSLRNYFVASIIRGKVRARVWLDSRYGQRFPVKPSIQEMTDSIDIPRSELGYFKLGKKLGQWGIDSEGDLIFNRTGTYVYWGKKAKKSAHHGVQFKDKRTGKFNVKSWLRFLVRGGGSYTRKRMIRVKEALKKDGVGAQSALRFVIAPGTFKVSKNFREELGSWLKRKRIRL